MKKKVMTQHIILCLFFILFLSCSDSDDIENGAFFYWGQTKCNDPWGTTENDSESTTRTAMKEYLKDNGIDRANILEFADTLKEGTVTCDGCGCQNGVIILVEVAETHSAKMEELGFKKK